jgi:predicted Rossmann-fold nucleotide-binding protein
MDPMYPKIFEDTVDRFRVTPEGTFLESLSPFEIDALFEKSIDDERNLFQQCVLAVLNSGEESDDIRSISKKRADFSVDVVRTAGGIELELKNAPLKAFVVYSQPVGNKVVDVPKLIEGIRQHIFGVIRDLVFMKSEMARTGKFNLSTPEGITDAVFLLLRNAGVFQKTGRHKVVVCFGGHSVSDEEYAYTKAVGYECGLRFMDIVTGCGPGAMKGPMEGAAIAHAKQRVKDGRYIGITEPGIIASEAPNAIVDPLVIMPDIEKRLEAFVRLGHGIIIFPGGAGTAEELVYLLGVLSHPNNRDIPFPLILTGPSSSFSFFERLDHFIRGTLGKNAASRYQVILDDPERVVKEMNQGLLKVKASRESRNNSYYFNRSLFIPPVFQEAFTPSFDSTRTLTVNPSAAPYEFAASLRRFFSAVVWGNVKPDGVRAIEQRGPLKVAGDPAVLGQVDELIRAFGKQRRLRLVGEYTPVYEIQS